MKFEYMIMDPTKIMSLGQLVARRQEKTVEELNRLGELGWEVVAVDRDGNYVLKREKV